MWQRARIKKSRIYPQISGREIWAECGNVCKDVFIETKTHEVAYGQAIAVNLTRQGEQMWQPTKGLEMLSRGPEDWSEEAPAMIEWEDFINGKRNV